MSGGITASMVLEGITAAAAVGSTIYAATASGAKAAAGGLFGQTSSSANRALTARSALLETAGGSGGSPLSPGQVGGTKDTLFGN